MSVNFTDHEPYPFYPFYPFYLPILSIFVKSDEYNNLIVTVIKVKKEMMIKKNEDGEKSEVKQNIRDFKKSLKTHN